MVLELIINKISVDEYTKSVEKEIIYVNTWKAIIHRLYLFTFPQG